MENSGEGAAGETVQKANNTNGRVALHLQWLFKRFTKTKSVIGASLSLIGPHDLEHTSDGTHLIWHPRAVCKLVSIGDSDDHSWLKVKRVTTLRKKHSAKRSLRPESDYFQSYGK